MAELELLALNENTGVGEHFGNLGKDRGIQLSLGISYLGRTRKGASEVKGLSVREGIQSSKIENWNRSLPNPYRWK